MNVDDAREVVLRRIGDALGASPAVPVVPRTYATTSDLPAEEIVTRFADRVNDYRAEVHHTDRVSLPDTLASIIASCGARRIGVPAGLDGSWLASLPADDGPEVVRDGDGLDTATLDTAALDTLDLIVTGAAVGIAETGTIVLDGSPDQGRRALTLVPDHHVCVVDAASVVHTVPEGIARLDATRPLTMISGPSATSDIELDRVEGVHGPRRLDVIVVRAGS